MSVKVVESSCLTLVLIQNGVFGGGPPPREVRVGVRFTMPEDLYTRAIERPTPLGQRIHTRDTARTPSTIWGHDTLSA